jgi:thiamine-monophosphate kinase
LKEFELIARHFAPLAKTASGALGLKDDAAILSCRAGHELVVTKDAIVEGIHFPVTKGGAARASVTPSQIARKLVRTNLSDMAAMGAEPKYYLIAAFLNPSVNDTWMKGFSAGLAADQKEFGITLIGGDTVKHSGDIAFSLTLLGEIKKGKSLKRKGAKAGDLVFVSGTLGDGALGLEVMNGKLKGLSVKSAEFLLKRYHVPNPRVALGRALANSGLVTAAMDVSDGLLADMGHICATSGVSAVLRQSEIPLSVAAKEAFKMNSARWEQVCTGGDDYELLFTAPRRAQQKLEALARAAGVKITAIGEVKKGKPEVTLLDAAGQNLVFSRGGYQHF